MKLPILTARIRTGQPVRGVPALLRGFFGNRQPENVLLHQHLGEGASTRLVYLYPRVQYQLRDGVPLIVGVADGIPAVAHATEALDVLELAGWRYDVVGVDYRESEIEIDERTEPCHYTFASPWLALNQKNHLNYQTSSWHERRDLLKRVLVGNVLSLCKSFDLAVVQRLNAVVDLRPTPVFIKKQKLVGFLGSFSINFQLGSGLGIGHLVSIGFGEVAAVNSGQDGRDPNISRTAVRPDAFEQMLHRPDTSPEFG
jgi:hypothetical protein